MTHARAFGVAELPVFITREVLKIAADDEVSSTWLRTVMDTGRGDAFGPDTIRWCSTGWPHLLVPFADVHVARLCESVDKVLKRVS